LPTQLQRSKSHELKMSALASIYRHSPWAVRHAVLGSRLAELSPVPLTR